MSTESETEYGWVLYDPHDEDGLYFRTRHGAGWRKKLPHPNTVYQTKADAQEFIDTKASSGAEYEVVTYEQALELQEMIDL